MHKKYMGLFGDLTHIFTVLLLIPPNILRIGITVVPTEIEAKLRQNFGV